MSKRILIAFATRYGNSAEVADFLADAIKKKGHNVDKVDLGRTRKGSWPDPSLYDIVVAGASIRIDKWTEQTKEFLVLNKAKFGSGKPRLAVYVCSGMASSKPKEAEDKYIRQPLVAMGLKANLELSVGPIYDFSEKSKLGFFMKKMVLAGSEDMEKESGRKIDRHARNDFRDWDSIRRFSEQIGQL